MTPASDDRCPQCGVAWIAHQKDSNGERFCVDVTSSITHTHSESDAPCPYRLYENWMRVMERPEEAVT